MKAATLLLVEDDQVDVLAVARACRASHITNEIVRAKDGIEALEILRGEGRSALLRPYIILLDLNLPRMNGIEFLTELRADPGLAATVVFVLTTSSAEEDLAAAYRHNVAGYILKSAGDDFVRVSQLLENYSQIVLLP